MKMNTCFFGALTIIGLALPASAAAQDLSADMASSDIDTLRAAVTMRYDAALEATRSGAIVSANDPRYIWASEAKAQCAIALGYLKSSTRDEPSLSKCDYAYSRMAMMPEPPAVVAVAPPPPPRPQEACGDQQPGIVFFEFDSAVPGDGAIDTIDFVSANADRCNWNSFRVVGHTDRAGSNAYNEALSMRRAQAVADLMANRGIARGSMSVSAEGETNPRVPTADGIRSPENRRVEVTVSR